MYLSANCQRTEQPEEIAWQMSTYAIETKELVSKELKKGGKENDKNKLGLMIDTK